MSPTVEELVKTSALQTPPKHQSLEDYLRDDRWRQRKLSASPWTGITATEDTQKALLDRYSLDAYKSLTTAPQTLDTFKPSPIIEALVEDFAKSHRESLDRVIEAWRPKANAFVALAERVALRLTSVQEKIRGWKTEAERRQERKEAFVEELLFSAYQTREELGRGRPEPMMRFLSRQLGTRTPNLDHVTALWEVLACDHDVLLNELLSADDPRAYLASRVAFRIRSMKTEFPSQDTFSRAAEEQPLASQEVYELTERNLVSKKSRVPPDFGAPRVRPAKNGMKPPSKDDPFFLVPAWHGDERQTLEEIAKHGRSQSRSRAQGVIDYHDRLRWEAELFDRVELVGNRRGRERLACLPGDGPESTDSSEGIQEPEKTLTKVSRIALIPLLPIEDSFSTLEATYGIGRGGSLLPPARSERRQRRASPNRPDRRSGRPTCPARQASRAGEQTGRRVEGRRSGRGCDADRRGRTLITHPHISAARRGFKARPPPSRAGPR